MNVYNVFKNIFIILDRKYPEKVLMHQFRGECSEVSTDEKQNLVPLKKNCTV